MGIHHSLVNHVHHTISLSGDTLFFSDYVILTSFSGSKAKGVGGPIRIEHHIFRRRRENGEERERRGKRDEGESTEEKRERVQMMFMCQCLYIIQHVPYSRKLSRKKTFVNEDFVKKTFVEQYSLTNLHGCGH